jgi:hypothetical protein
MSSRYDEGDGSEIFWPGYVDATTNLILNLLFLLTILIVAVFMFALELGRTSKLEVQQTQQAPIDQQARVIAGTTADSDEQTGVAEVDAPVAGDKRALELEFPDSVQAELERRNLALQREVDRLNQLLAEQRQQVEEGGGSAETAVATVVPPEPENGLDQTLSGDFEVVVRFKRDAIDFTGPEHDGLLESLRPLVEHGTAGIHVVVPGGFSEAKRMGFYRAMAVRNLLLEAGLSGENINVSVVEGDFDSDAAEVRVRTR